MVVKGFHVSNEIQSDKDFCAIVHFMCSLNYIYGIILFKGLSKKREGKAYCSRVCHTADSRSFVGSELKCVG